MGNMRLIKLSKKGKAILAFSFFVFLISGLGLYYLIFSPDWSVLSFLNSKKPVNENIEVPVVLDSSQPDCPDCLKRWLDGEMVAPDRAEAFPIAVMIDNDPAARPQFSLAQASLVYEAPVEGGMTRYMAIYPADTDILKVGPIRSARPYFVLIAAELGAIYLHVGGSPEALSDIKRAIYMI